MNKPQIWLALFLLLAIIAGIFSSGLQNGFSAWDDPGYVLDNPLIRSLSAANLGRISSAFLMDHYHPLTTLAYALQYHYFKLNPFPYHLFSIILHLLNCALVFWLVYLLSGSKLPVAWIAALLFGIHPLQVESVAWISAQKNLLNAFFFLGSVLAYIYYLREKTLRYYLFSLSLFFLSLLAKSMAVTLPLVLLLLDYYFSRPASKKGLMEKIPYFGLALIFGAIVIQHTLAVEGFRREGGNLLWNSVTLGAHNFIFYLQKMFLPAGLSCYYPYFGLNSIAVKGATLAALLVLAGGIILSAKYTKKVIFGAGYFLIVLLPVLPFLPNRQTIAADRYVYLALIGMAFLISQAIYYCYTRKPEKASLLQAFLVLTVAAGSVFLCGLSWNRIKLWNSDAALWEDAIKNYPGSPLPYYNLGNAYLSAGRSQEALTAYRRAIEIYPDFADAYNGLGYLYRLAGNTAQAKYNFLEAIRINPRLAAAYYNLGKLYEDGGLKEEAIKAYSRAIGINGRYVEAYNDLAALYADRGDIDLAIGLWEKAAKISPELATVNFNLAVFYFRQSKFDLALRYCDKVIASGSQVDPEFLKLLAPYRKR